MPSISTYLENAILNHTLRNVSFSPPTTVYVGLFLNDPTEDDTGTEVSGGGYARQPATFSAPVAGSTSNNSDIEFPVAATNWGTITHLGIYDAVSGGNLLYHGPFTVSKVIQVGDQFIVRSSDLDITIF